MFNIILLGITSLLTDISSEMVYPLIPIYLVSRLGASPAILGLVEGIAETTASLLKVFSGHISDRAKKRKPFAISGYSLSAAGKLLLYLSSNWWHVLSGRVIDRFGKGIRTAPRDALISESTSSDKKGTAFGLHRAMDTTGAAIGVLISYLIFSSGEDDFGKVFLFSLIPALLGVSVLFLVRERKRVERPEVPSKGRITPSSLIQSFLSLDPRLRRYLLVTLLFALGNSSNQFILLRANSAGFSAKNVILLYLLYNIIYAIVSLPSGRLSDRMNKKLLLSAGYILYGLIYLGFGIFQTEVAIVTLFAFYGFYSGLTEGVEKAYISELSPLDRRATLIGLHATITGIGLLPASLIAGGLWSLIDLRAPFIFGCITALTAGLILLLK